MALSLRGDPKAAVENLILHGTNTQNAKLIETAFLVLQRYEAKIDDHAKLLATVQDLRTRFAPANSRSVLGEPKRQAGQLSLRTGGAAARTLPGLAPTEPAPQRHAFLPPGST
jgi:hypothetical protein